MKKLLRHLFLPHTTNNHRAKFLHHSTLLVVIVSLLALGGIFSYVASHNKAVLGISYSITTEDLLIHTNAKRQEKGLPPLTISPELAQAASRKADDMLAKNYWAHIAPDGTTPWYFIRSSGYEYVYAGENLARGFTSSEEVVNAWMASPSHRENLLSSNYTDIGFAIKEGNLTGDETVLVVQEFGSRTRAIAQSPVIQPTTAPVTITPSPSQATFMTTPTPTPVPVVEVVVTTTPTPASIRYPVEVAAYQNDPLINKPAAQKNIALIVVLAIIILLILDVIIVERRGIIRILSHNIDHIIFFGMILLLILLISRGGIL